MKKLKAFYLLAVTGMGLFCADDNFVDNNFMDLSNPVSGTILTCGSGSGFDGQAGQIVNFDIGSLADKGFAARTGTCVDCFIIDGTWYGNQNGGSQTDQVFFPDDGTMLLKSVTWSSDNSPASILQSFDFIINGTEIGGGMGQASTLPNMPYNPPIKVYLKSIEYTGGVTLRAQFEVA